MFSKEISIKNKYNKFLSILLEYPDDTLKDYIIFNHCFTCSKNYKIYNNISKILVKNGYGTIRFDMTGLGDSEGDFEDTNLTTNIEDLISVYEYISSNYKTPKFLIGHSLGGLISIKAASQLPFIKGIATIGTPYNLNGLIKLFSKYEDELSSKGKTEIDIAGRKFKIGDHFLEDIKNENIHQSMRKFDKPIIIFHSNKDKTVPFESGLKLFNLISSPKSFITLQDANHLVSNKDDGYYIGSILARWFDENKG
ncbi:alpha/beta hydrolase [Clostridium sp. D2Q-11]|uniref:Alpha/beta hydrolase n=1 Tax=Anaeromonas frigoriresistens TaxID=2683708 RepID=A0A942UZJ8_9FIRM|nr:alpha/beta hydrolase [Anaeromonas frigoriresistens]MBS4538452.1 alpha/beta hydrolase [Anaeromonas frigoriresistens]